MFFNFDDLEAALPSITEDLIDHHQAEESSPGGSLKFAPGSSAHTTAPRLNGTSPFRITMETKQTTES